MGVTNSIMATRDEAKATEVLTSLFQKVDVNANGALCLSELKRVFGEHAGQFLTFCDGDDDKEISVDEWLKGILGDTADLSEEEFQATWVERMGGCVAAAEGATLGGQTLAEIVALTPAQLVALGLSEDLAGEKASLFVAAANRLLAMGIAPETPANGFYVPGRIEVMGKHTDYAGGRSLLAAASKSFCVFRQTGMTTNVASSPTALVPLTQRSLLRWLHAPRTVRTRPPSSFLRTSKLTLRGPTTQQ